MNSLLLLAEAVLYFAVMTALFRLRGRFGIGVFFCVLGTMHFLETYLAAIFYVQLAAGIVISPGSVVLFSGKLVMLLLVYIREDAATVRQPIYGLLFGNFLIVGLVYLLRFHQVAPAAPDHLPDLGFLGEMGALMLWGTLLLFIDSILIVLAYERMRTWFGSRQLPRIALSAIAVLAFDQLGFFAALHFYVGVPVSALTGGLVAKFAAAIVFGLMAAGYLRFVEPVQVRVGKHPRLSDVFDTLTYRERYEALLAETGHDALTGLLDRGRFDREAPAIVKRAVAAGQPVSFLVADIDHFKRINDEHGHAMGDEALRHIARQMGGALRSADQIYRYGGEEFVVVCEGLAHGAACLAAERLRRTVASVEVPGLPGIVTTSIGVATSSEDGTTLGELFGTADARLYAAKEGGRDRVVGRTAAHDPALAGRPQRQTA
ncbi:MAG: GGDEF domain-containing protein [Rhizobiales bacterium]|nr:GGDEF domain-containing protein [Hyphomicrobiales bacterium]MBN9010658.1 GGDEF domain-containing protein [Hyphomicrobiales bacterium]